MDNNGEKRKTEWSSSVDSFVEETDYQYQYVYGGSMGGYIARAKDTMYFKIGSYIYQMDEQTEILMPLCNKPNCLHDKETNDERIEECYAYFIEKTKSFSAKFTFICG